MFCLISEPEQLIADVIHHCSVSEVRQNIFNEDFSFYGVVIQIHATAGKL